jgi:hypothetical protein
MFRTELQGDKVIQKDIEHCECLYIKGNQEEIEN